MTPSGGPHAAEGLVLAGQGLPHGPDVGRGGAAAAADDPHPEVQEPVVVGGHLLGRAGKMVFPSFSWASPAFAWEIRGSRVTRRMAARIS